MKKRLIIMITVILLTLTLTGCKSNKGQLIEISDDEFVKAVDNKQNFIIAFTNENNFLNDDYIKALSDYAEETKKIIYYMDINHLSVYTEVILEEGLGYESGLAYSVIKDGVEELTEQYVSQAKLRKDIGKYASSDEIELIDEESTKETIKIAEHKLEEHKISEALQYINSVWSKKSAKDFYNNNNILKFVRRWDCETNFGDNFITIKLESYPDFNKLYIAKKENYKENVNPEEKDYISYDYIIKDDIIYISEDGKKYSEYAKITILEEKKMILRIDDKEYIFLPNYS